MSKLAFLFNQIDDYLNCPHRIFIQQLIEADTVIHSKALGLVSDDQFMRGRNDNMSKRVWCMMLILTERADIS